MNAHLHRQRAIVIALLLSLLLWNLPYGGLMFYPFKLLATWMHELSHGLFMLLTGAGFRHMEIYQDTSGLAFAARPVGTAASAAIAAAGYMGTPLIGAAMLVVGQRRRGTRAILAVLGVVMALTALCVIANRFGQLAVGSGAALCFLAAAIAPERPAALLMNFVAVQACIHALLDIRVLFRSNLLLNGTVIGNSDAHNMAAVTFGTPSLWAGVWLTWSLALLYIGLRWIYLQERYADAEPPAHSSPPAH